jgi:hypothetical protein
VVVLSKRVHAKALSTLVNAVGRVMPSALARGSLALALCFVLGTVSGHGRPAILPTAVLTFALIGALSLGRGLRAEKRKTLSEAEYMYSLSLVNYLMSYSCVVFLRMVESTG